MDSLILQSYLSENCRIGVISDPHSIDIGRYTSPINPRLCIAKLPIPILSDDRQKRGRYNPGIDRWLLCDEAIWYWVSGITAIHPIVLGIDISSKYRIGIRDYEGLLIHQYWRKFSFRDRKLLKFTENISRWVVSTLIYILVLDMVWGKNTWLFFRYF